MRYEELGPMLLNEIQKQAKVIDALTARLAKLEEQQVHGSGVIDSHWLTRKHDRADLFVYQEADAGTAP